MQVTQKPEIKAQAPLKFNARIKVAMTSIGLEPTPAALHKAWLAKYGKTHAIARQSFYDWLKSEKPKISITHLYGLSDLLSVNARWLSCQDHDVFGQMGKPMFVTPELRRLTDAFHALGPTGREELIRSANRLLAIQGESSSAYPLTTKQ